MTPEAGANIGVERLWSGDDNSWLLQHGVTLPQGGVGRIDRCKRLVDQPGDLDVAGGPATLDDPDMPFRMRGVWRNDKMIAMQCHVTGNLVDGGQRLGNRQLLCRDVDFFSGSSHHAYSYRACLCDFQDIADFILNEPGKRRDEDFGA